MIAHQKFTNERNCLMKNAPSAFSSFPDYSGPSLLLTSSEIHKVLDSPILYSNPSCFYDKVLHSSSDLPDQQQLTNSKAKQIIKATDSMHSTNGSTNLVEGDCVLAPTVCSKLLSAFPRQKAKLLPGRRRTSKAYQLNSSLCPRISCSDSKHITCRRLFLLTKQKSIIVLTVLGTLLVISVIILWIVLSRQHKRAQDFVQFHVMSTASTVVTVTNSPFIRVPSSVCHTATCLQISNIITGRLGRANVSTLHSTGGEACDVQSLYEKVAILSSDRKQHSLSTGVSVQTLARRLLSSIWISVSETLQSLPALPQSEEWFHKLAFLYQRMVAGSAVNNNPALNVPRLHYDSHLSERLKPEMEGKQTEKIQNRMRLQELLQRGNIAFHGLDNVLISVQLELRVPLFFSTWVTKTYNQGLLETTTPFFGVLSQPEFSSLVDGRDANEPENGPWRELYTYINRLAQLATMNASGLTGSLPNSIITPPRAMVVLYSLHSMLRKTSHLSKKPVEMTLRELMQKTQKAINLPRYLGHLMTGNHSIAIRSDLTVWVTDVNYFEELGRLLSETSFSDLQDYVSFCILNKYAPYAYSESGNLKQKFLKPLAESIGMQHVEGWPYLLDIASPGFKLLILQRWNWKHLERSTQAIRRFVFRPILEELQALIGLLITDVERRRGLLHTLSTMEMRMINSNYALSMKRFYKAWDLRANESLLDQVITYNTFLSLKALPPTLNAMFDDPGLSSNGRVLTQYLADRNTLDVSVLLTQWPYFATDSGVPSYIKFGPMWYSFGKTMTEAILTEHFRQMSSTKPLAWLEETVKAMDLNGINPNISNLLARYLSQDEQLSFLNGHRIYSSFLALELAGRIYLKHMDRTDSSADAHLLKANLPRAISFYVWLFQSICEGNKQQLTSFQRNTNNGLFDECRAAQAAVLISPAFHKIIGCADLRFPTTTDDQTSLLKQGVGSRTFYPPTKVLD